MLAPEQIYQFHVTMIEHGRKICSARGPHCEICVLKVLCPAAAENLLSEENS
jgi:endonuclease III